MNNILTCSDILIEKYKDTNILFNEKEIAYTDIINIDTLIQNIYRNKECDNNFIITVINRNYMDYLIRDKMLRIDFMHEKLIGTIFDIYEVTLFFIWNKKTKEITSIFETIKYINDEKTDGDDYILRCLALAPIIKKKYGHKHMIKIIEQGINKFIDNKAMICNEVYYTAEDILSNIKISELFATFEFIIN